MTWLMLAAGLALLVLGSEWLVNGAARLAADFGVPSLIIGLTIVAFGTSAPELAVSVKSAWSGQTELAVANVVGSNIFNVLFILGLAALISPLLVSPQLVRRDVPLMIGASALAMLLLRDGALARWEAAVLFAGVILYTLFLFREGRKQGADEPDLELVDTHVPTWRNVALMAGGLALLVLGSRWLVESAIEIASSFGVSEAVIGLTIVAAGTSLPEVMTSIMATIKGQRDIAIGNVVGSNLFNILCVLGLSGLVAPTPLLAGSQMAQLDIPVMFAIAVLCLPMFFAGGRLSRIDGLVFLALYVAYVAYLIALATAAGYLETLQTVLVSGLIPAVILYVGWTVARDIPRRKAL